MGNEVFSARVRCQTANEYLSQSFVFDVFRNFTVFLDGLVDFNDSVPDQVRLDAEDSIVGLLVFTIDEAVAFGDACMIYFYWSLYLGL